MVVEALQAAVSIASATDAVQDRLTSEPSLSTSLEKPMASRSSEDLNGKPTEDEYEDENDDDDDDEAYRLIVSVERSKTISETARLNAAFFRTWVDENHEKVADDARKRGKGNQLMSLTQLLDDFGSSKIITSPREYQIDLFERAKEKNIIVVLDTGSGKTLISALLLRHTLNKELEHRASGRPKQIAFFLVEKVGLCFQQHKVLSDNLEHEVTKVYGEMPGMENTKSFWDAQFNESMCIVCTAQILLDCLNNAFIRVRDINLLIFDEAHHTKKNHPYARIIKQHYLREADVQLRPRILGMTASPVDAQTRDMRLAAAELEGLLCSEIATVSTDILTRNFMNRQLAEETEQFDALEELEDSKTPLWEEIFNEVSDNPQLRAPLELSKGVSRTLGRWCADRFWQKSMTESEIARLIALTENDLRNSFGYGGKTETAVSAIRRIQEIMSRHPLEPVSRTPRLKFISSKVQTLWEILDASFNQMGTQRCMVFVDRRCDAYLLADLFQQPGMRVKGVVPAYIIGRSNASPSLASMPLREQILALRSFKTGQTNCLFATSVAEEGIDIPACDLIIRFDLYNTVIQYIQSKGRARHARSRYISMIEKGNFHDLRRVKQAGRDFNALQQFCSALPDDRKIQDQPIDTAAIAEVERLSKKVHEVPETGARLGLHNSMEVLAKFVSSFSSEMTGSLSPEYSIISDRHNFSADVILPDVCPINCVSGFPQRTKQLAKYSAAFEACMILMKKNYIDGHLQPTLVKKTPALRNARLAVSSNKQAEYAMRMKPKLWSELGSWEDAEASAVAFVLQDPSVLDRASKPIILICRKPLRSMPDVALFFGNGRSSVAKVIEAKGTMNLSRDQVSELANFTLRLFEDVFSKEFVSTPDEMPYLLAPCADSHRSLLEGGPVHIDWPLLAVARQQDQLTWEGQPDEFFSGKFIVDPAQGSRKMIAHGINKTLRPSDPVPDDAVEPTFRAWQMVEHNIKEYSSGLWMRARKKAEWRDDQPVVNVEILSLRRDFTAQFEMDQEQKTKGYVILEPLRVSPITVEIVTMALVLPTILHRVEYCLIALDACSVLDLDIRPDLALEALTKDSDNSGDHGEEQVNFQAGMGNNYERLEFLGDTFLKMATTIATVTRKPELDEFECHVRRMLMLCNQNLFNHAVNRSRSIQEYIRSRGFDRRSWYPNLTLKKGKAAKDEFRHNLSDKSIADVCEALIGAAYLSFDGDGNERMDMAVRAVSAVVNSNKHRMNTFSAYYASYKMPTWQATKDVSAVNRAAIDKIEKAVGYRFTSPLLLRSAFKHPSYPYERDLPNYQRLEFLGDALLDMATVDHLFRKYPAADPQWLTEHKMAMVSNQFFGFLCIELGLHKHLLFTTSALVGQVSEYSTDVEHARELAKEQVAAAAAAAAERPVANGEEEAEPSLCSLDSFWVDIPSTPPKMLADAVESLIGAMFVDSRYDYSVVQRFFDRFVAPHFVDMSQYDRFAIKHPIVRLTRRLQDEFGCKKWRLYVAPAAPGAEEGVRAVTSTVAVAGLVIHGEVVEHATSESDRYAKIAVAKKAGRKFDEMDRETYRAQVRCNCKVVDDKKKTSEGGTDSS